MRCRVDSLDWSRVGIHRLFSLLVFLGFSICARVVGNGLGLGHRVVMIRAMTEHSMLG